MSESVTPQDHFPRDPSIPENAASLESILCTEELHRRPPRPPDYEKENRALGALAAALTGASSAVLQTLAETILDVNQCDSAGVSLLTKEETGAVFHWSAIAGLWKPYIGREAPRYFSHSGDVLERNRPLLFRRFERRYSYLLPLLPAAEECLSVPFYVAGRAVGTIWAILHSGRRHFDAEDERLMTSLGRFASVAYQTLASIGDLQVQIAARRQAESALRKLARGLEAKIQRFVGANILGIFTWNLAGSIVDANESFLSMVQCGRDELTSGSLRWMDLTPAEWRARDELAVASLQATGTVQPYRKEFFRKDGSRIPVLAGAALLEEDSHEGIAFVLDLTELMHAEQALQRAEQHTRSIVDSALDAVVAMDNHGLITNWNKRAEEFFGWTRAEAIGRRMSETIIPPQYRLAHERGLRRFFDTGARVVLNQRIEITALRRSGVEFPVELTVTPLKSGDTWTFSSFIRDISDRKRAEEQLRASELNLRRMTETIPEMLWSATPDGAIDYCNARVLDYTGLSPEEVKRTGWVNAIHPDDVAKMTRAWTHSVARGDSFHFEFRGLRAADGMYRWCVSSALPLRASDGAILKWYGTVVDFHDRWQAQEDLRTAQAELAHVNRVMTMGELTASIAHEVSQPIAAIIASGDSCTAWLDAQPPNLEKARLSASRMIQAATQAGEIVHRVRALFKKTPSIASSVDMNQLIEETTSLIHSEALRKNVSLRTELNAALPAVTGDRVQLEQVILNLIMNGIESMADFDSDPKRLSVRSALAGPGELLVSVADTGPGIDAQQAARLFAPFFTTKPQGIGMGLPISRSIIEAHHGRLWAGPNEPRGAVFHFTLPVATPAE